MERLILFVMACVTLCTLAVARPKFISMHYPFRFVDRCEWGANPPSYETPLALPVPYVVIHHSYTPGVCMNVRDCSSAMRGMQNFHQIDNGWADIGYNFAVGGDGSAYEGRGWTTVGAHAIGYNSLSIGICIIGDWVSNVPPQEALETTKQLIARGVELGFISPDYQLIGHRQATPTECPGQALFQEISTWERFRVD